MLRWQCQDVECAKCGLVMGDDMVFSEHCTKCGGAWRGTVSNSERREMKGEIEVLERIAGGREGYGMRMLEGVLRGVGEMGL